MRHIYQILQRFLTLFKKRTKPNSDLISTNNQHLSTEEYIGSLTFKLTNHGDVDISCGFPDAVDWNNAIILEMAEKYAQFLLLINEGHTQEDILSILRGKEKDLDIHEKDRLFINNIITFWAMLHVEQQTVRTTKDKTDQPVIRPLAVFGGR